MSYGVVSRGHQAADAASRLAEGEDPDAAQLPPGTVEFNIQPPQLTAALAEDSLAVDAAPDIDVPDALLPQERLDELIAQRQPAFVPLPGATAVSSFPSIRASHFAGSVACVANTLRSACFVNECYLAMVRLAASQVDTTPDPATGVVRLQLSNGIKVNFRRTDNEPQAAMIRMVAAGGRACEGMLVAGTLHAWSCKCALYTRSPVRAVSTMAWCAAPTLEPRDMNVGEGTGPDGVGVVSIGARALSESGTVGSWQRSQVELFCISKLINCVLESDEEFVCMDLHFAVGESASCPLLPHGPFAGAGPRHPAVSLQAHLRLLLLTSALCPLAHR
jgi:hypothetical protein